MFFHVRSFLGPGQNLPSPPSLTHVPSRQALHPRQWASGPSHAVAVPGHRMNHLMGGPHPCTRPSNPPESSPAGSPTTDGSSLQDVNRNHHGSRNRIETGETRQNQKAEPYESVQALKARTMRAQRSRNQARSAVRLSRSLIAKEFDPVNEDQNRKRNRMRFFRLGSFLLPAPPGGFQAGVANLSEERPRVPRVVPGNGGCNRRPVYISSINSSSSRRM